MAGPASSELSSSTESANDWSRSSLTCELGFSLATQKGPFSGIGLHDTVVESSSWREMSERERCERGKNGLLRSQ
jgi:hypothetical protein